MINCIKLEQCCLVIDNFIQTDFKADSYERKI